MGIFLAWGLCMCNYRASVGCGVTMGGGGLIERGGGYLPNRSATPLYTLNCYTNMKTGIFPHTNGIVKALQSGDHKKLFFYLKAIFCFL